MNTEHVLHVTTTLNGLTQMLEQAARHGQRTRREREAMELMMQARNKLLADLEARRQEQEAEA